MGVLSFLFPDEHIVSFPTKLAPAAALAKLQAAVTMTFHLLPPPGMHGRMVDDTIRLWRVRLTRNSFRPIFEGKFVQQGSGAALEGRFRAALPAKVFILVWLNLVLLLTTIGTAAFSSSAEAKHMALVAPAMGVTMLGFGVTLARLGAWFGKQDREVIAQTIRDALG